MKSKREQLFQSSSVWRAIFAMAIPAVVNMLVMVFYNMADMFFIAQLHDDIQVGAVSIATPVFTMIMALGSMIGGGGCALIARTLGEGDSRRVRLYTSLCCWGSLVLGALFGLLVLAFRGRVLRFLGVNTEMWPYAQSYLTVLLIGTPIMVFTTAFGNVIRADGAVMESMIGHLLATASNILLDPLFILTFHWGVAGAAAATVLSNLLGAVYLVWYALRKSQSISLSPGLAVSAPLEFRHILAIGLPNGTNSMLTSLASALANNLMVQHGTLAVAAMAAAGKSTTIITMVQMGVCVGVQPLLAFHYGARNLARIREILHKLSILTVALGLSMTLLCFFGSEWIISLFLKDKNALALGQTIIRLRVLTGPVMGFYYISTNFLQASGNAKRSTFASLLRQGILLIPLLYLMNALFGVLGNVSAHMAADTLATIIAAFLAIKQMKKLYCEGNTAKTEGGHL